MAVVYIVQPEHWPQPFETPCRHRQSVYPFQGYTHDTSFVHHGAPWTGFAATKHLNGRDTDVGGACNRELRRSERHSTLLPFCVACDEVHGNVNNFSVKITCPHSVCAGGEETEAKKRDVPPKYPPEYNIPRKRLQISGIKIKQLEQDVIPPCAAAHTHY